MTPTDAAGGPPPAGKSATVAPAAGKSATVADAKASLAPFHTHFAHRPDWQVAAEDAAEEQREHTGG